MRKSVDFYYDYISPASYFAWVRLQDICTRTGATINYKPMLLGGVMKANGNPPPITIPAKWEWIKKDFARTAADHNIPYTLNTHFPFNTVNVMRGALWALMTGKIEEYNKAMYTAAWQEGKDISSPEVLREVLSGAGFDADLVMEEMTRPEIKQALIDATDKAAARGVFGAPTAFVGDEIYFGQDRLHWVEEDLS